MRVAQTDSGQHYLIPTGNVIQYDIKSPIDEYSMQIDAEDVGKNLHMRYDR